MGVTTVPIDPEFRLYITTEHAYPVFTPEVAVYTNLINFSITKQALEAQLLSKIVMERADSVEREFLQLKVKAHDCAMRLDKIEQLILKELESDILELLDDEQLIENLTQSSYTSKKLGQTL